MTTDRFTRTHLGDRPDAGGVTGLRALWTR